VRTGDIGMVKIVEESGVAQGVRRMEAVTGKGAMEYMRKLEDELGQAAEPSALAPSTSQPVWPSKPPSCAIRRRRSAS